MRKRERKGIKEGGRRKRKGRARRRGRRKERASKISPVAITMNPTVVAHPAPNSAPYATIQGKNNIGFYKEKKVRMSLN